MATTPTATQIGATECARPITAPRLTHRESRYIALRVNGSSQHDAAIACGWSESMARSAYREIETGIVASELERLRAEAVALTLEQGLIDAVEVHEYLTAAVRAKISDIRNDDGSYKPVSQWPDIWQQMYEQGDCTVETKSERSHDGRTKDKDGGWDAAGIVTKVTVRFTSRAKLLELAMRHVGVRALAAEDINLNVSISAQVDEKIAAGRLRAAERNKLLERVVEVADEHKE